MHKWIREYNEQIRTNAFKKINFIKPKELARTPEEIKEGIYKWFKMIWDEYEKFATNERHAIGFSSTMFYDTCIKSELFVPTDDEKKKIYNEAKDVLMKKCTLTNAKNEGERIKFRKVLDSIGKNSGDESVKAMLVVETKSLFTKIIFQRFKDLNLKFEDAWKKVETKIDYNEKPSR